MQDIINEVDQDGSGKVSDMYSEDNIVGVKVEWPEFASVLATLLEAEKDEEENYKETFRVFSKDDEGCIPAQEMKFVLSQICSMEVTTFSSTKEIFNHFRRLRRSWVLWTVMVMVL